MKIKNSLKYDTYYFRILISILIFILSLYVFSFYQQGDQLAYRFFYEYAKNIDSVEWYLFWSQYTISTIEPIYIFFAWIFSSLHMPKDVFISLFNSIFTYLLISVLQLKKFNTHIVIIVLIVFLNYYVLVLLFSAERLKFGILFILLYMLSSNSNAKYSFILLAILSHSQILVGYLCYLFKEVISNFKNINLKVLFLFICIFVFLGEHIYQKVLYYIKFDNSTDVLIKSLLFLVLSLYYSKNKFETVLFFIPLLIAIFFLGDDRLNMFAYFIFLYYALQVNRGINIGVVVTSLYFSYKSFIFVEKFFLYGDGFYK